MVVAQIERRGQFPAKALLDCRLQGIQVEDWPTFLSRLRLGQLEDRLSRCADKIALRSFAQLLEALEHPKPRACRAVYRQRLLERASLVCGKSIIHDVEHRRQVSERTIRTALARYGSEAHSAFRKYFP